MFRVESLGFSLNPKPGLLRVLQGKFLGGWHIGLDGRDVDGEFDLLRGRLGRVAGLHSDAALPALRHLPGGSLRTTLFCCFSRS